MRLKHSYIFILSILFTATLINSSNSSGSSIQYYHVNAETVTSPSLQLNHVQDMPSKPRKHSKRTRLISIIKDLLDTEVKKLESSITDSVMEEVINYYGHKLNSAESLDGRVKNLDQKFSTLNSTVGKLNNNYKFFVKSHQNLVNTVRNNINNAKRTRERYLKLKYAKALHRKSLREKNIANTRALSENNRQKNSEQTTKTSIIKAETLKKQLIKDLETKYSSLIDNNLTHKIVEKLNKEDGQVMNDKKAKVSSLISSDRVKDEKLNLEDDMIDDDGVESEPVDELDPPSDCQDLSKNGFVKDGVYKIYALKTNKSIDVYCEFENDIGWTVLQRRHDGSVSFDRNWQAYKNGFGDIFENKEFWLGLDNMHSLTNQYSYSLQIIMTDWNNKKFTAEYGHFKIDNEKSKYKLEVNNYFSNSTAGDSFGSSMNAFQSHNKMAFSTYDSDNDMRFYDNCAQIFKSGWWFNACFQSNLNGAYYKYSDKDASTGQSKTRRLRQEENSQLRFLRNGIHWNSIDFYKSLKSTKLRIRRN